MDGVTPDVEREMTLDALSDVRQQLITSLTQHQIAIDAMTPIREAKSIKNLYQAIKDCDCAQIMVYPEIRRLVKNFKMVEPDPVLYSQLARKIRVAQAQAEVMSRQVIARMQSQITSISNLLIDSRKGQWSLDMISEAMIRMTIVDNMASQPEVCGYLQRVSEKTVSENNYNEISTDAEYKG